MEKEERLDKLDEVLKGVVDDYGRLLSTYKERVEYDSHGKMTVIDKGKGKERASPGASAVSNGKRPSPVEEDDDSESGEPLPKRPKV